MSRSRMHFVFTELTILVYFLPFFIICHKALSCKQMRIEFHSGNTNAPHTYEQKMQIASQFLDGCFFFPINLSKLRSCSTTIKTNKIETIFYESLVFFRVCIKWIMHLERLTQTGLPIFVFCFSLEWLNSISLNFVFWILHIFISFRNFCAYMHFVWGNSFFSIWLTSYF